MFRPRTDSRVSFRWLRQLAPAVAGVCFMTAAQAAEVSVQDVWLRQPAPGQSVAGVFLTIRSEQNAALVAASSPVAGSAQLHRMSMDNGVMRMRPVARIDLPAGQTVRLAPGGLHVMLLDLRRQLHAGERIPLALVVNEAGHHAQTLEVQAEVRDLGGQPAGRAQP